MLQSLGCLIRAAGMLLCSVLYIAAQDGPVVGQSKVAPVLVRPAPHGEVAPASLPRLLLLGSGCWLMLLVETRCGEAQQRLP